MFAAAADRADVVSLLLEKGADPNTTTTLMEAATRSAVDNYAGERMQEVLDAFKGDGKHCRLPPRSRPPWRLPGRSARGRGP